jgi:hypothetical protein
MTLDVSVVTIAPVDDHRGDRKPAQARALLSACPAREVPAVLHGQSWRTEAAVQGLCPARVKFVPKLDPGGLFAFHEASSSSRQARWLVRVRSSGWPFHHAPSRIRLRAAAA